MSYIKPIKIVNGVPKEQKPSTDSLEALKVKVGTQELTEAIVTSIFSALTKLDGIEPGATANSSDSFLLDRANHTGTQTASTISDFSTAVDSRIDAQKGEPLGLATLDSNGLVPASQLPSFVDDVLEYADLASFPVTGESSVIYVDLATGSIYRWSGSTYIEISPSPGSTDDVVEGSINLYFTNARADGRISAQKAQANGLATLDGSSKIPIEQISTSSASSIDASSTNAEGTSSSLARADHAHDIPTGAPSSLGTANTEGTSSSLARADHVHAHGSQTDPAHHAVASGTNNGFMSSSDKSKLDGIESGATVNQADAFLLSRANHTGTQASATISDFTEAAQDAIGSSLLNSADIDHTYDDTNNTISSLLTPTGVTPGNYRGYEFTIDSKGRITAVQQRSFLYLTTSTQSTTSTTFAGINELESTTLTAGLYRISVTGTYRSAATGTGIGFRMASAGGTISSVAISWNVQQAGNGTNQNYQYKQTTENINVTSASVVAANTNYTFTGEGLLRISSSDVLTVQFRSETNGTAVTIQPDCALSIERIA